MDKYINKNIVYLITGLGVAFILLGILRLFITFDTSKIFCFSLAAFFIVISSCLDTDELFDSVSLPNYIQGACFIFCALSIVFLPFLLESFDINEVFYETATDMVTFSGLGITIFLLGRQTVTKGKSENTIKSIKILLEKVSKNIENNKEKEVNRSC